MLLIFSFIWVANANAHTYVYAEVPFVYAS